MELSILGIYELYLGVFGKRREGVNLGLRGEDTTVLERVGRSSGRQRGPEDRLGYILDISVKNEIPSPLILLSSRNTTWSQSLTSFLRRAESHSRGKK